MKKRGMLFFVMCACIDTAFAGEDGAFDFTTDSFDRVDDATQLRRVDNSQWHRDFPLDGLSLHRRPVSSERPDVTTSLHRTPGDNNTLSLQNYNAIVDPWSLEQDLSLRDRAALDALNDDHIFFDDLDDDAKKVTPQEWYRIQLRDCRNLIEKSAEGVRDADQVLYKSMQPQFALVQKQVTQLMARSDAPRANEIVLLENSLQELKASVAEKITGRLFKVLILDALRLAVRKLSHIRVTPVKMQKGPKKKELHVGKKDSKKQIEEAPYVDY